MDHSGNLFPAQWLPSSFGTIAQDFTSGVVLTILNVTTAISIAALVFSGAPPQLFFVGVAVVLFSTVLCALGGTFGSGFGRVISAPRSGLAPIYAAMVSSVVATIPADAPAFVPTVMIVIMVGTLTTGVFLFAVGQFRFGTLIRFIPYPVMAGFFAGIGLMFVLGGIAVASGEPIELETIGFHLSPTGLALASPAVLMGVLLFVVTLRFRHWSVFPLVLAAAIAVFYVSLAASGTTAAVAIAAGWLPSPAEANVTLPFVELSAFGQADWPLVLKQAGAFASLAVLTTIILLVDTSGIEIIADRDLDPDRELKVAGLTNIANGLFGGYTGTQAASDTALFVKLGAATRLSGFLYAAFVVLVMLVGTDMVGLIPSYVLGGLLIYFGLDFLVSWTWAKRRDLPLHDLAIVAAIVLSIVFIGLLEGIAIGCGIALVQFVISYSRLSVVKTEHGGDVHDSIVVRHPAERAYLSEVNRRIWVMTLRGSLFFGTAERLLKAIKERVETAQSPGISHFALGFADVRQMDTSAIHTLVKLGKYAERRDLAVVMSGLSEADRHRIVDAGFAQGRNREILDTGGLFHPTLAAAVAWCEEDLLTSFDRHSDDADNSIENLLAGLTGAREAADQLAPFFKPVELAKGGYLFREGDDSTSLFLLGSGVASVVMNAESGRERVIRIFEEGTMVGEMALFTGEPRSASVRVEEDTTFYRLTRHDFLDAYAKHPAAAGRLLSFVVRLLSERLARANREIQSLQASQ